MRRDAPSSRAFMRNMRQPMPLAIKARKTLRNVLVRLSGKSCCGHPGEPGC